VSAARAFSTQGPRGGGVHDRMREASSGLACVLVACAWMAGCGHGTQTVIRPPVPPDEPPSEVELARWEDAAALFARHEAAGDWDGEACLRTLGAFESVSEGGQRAQAVYMTGLVAQRCGNEDGARRLFSRALEIDETLCEARVALAVMDLEGEHVDRARAAFARAVELDNQCVPAYLNLASLQAQLPGQREAAVANLRRALAVRADYLPALDQLARVYLAWSDERPELLRLAAVVCRQAQLIDDGYAPIYNTWALIDLAQGDPTAAAAKLDRAVTLDPTFFAAWMNFGQVTLSQRAYEDAARAFGRARELRPGSYDAAIGLGVALRGLTRPEDAEASYRAALEIDDDRAEAWFDLAVLYHEHRQGTPAQLRQALSFLDQFARRARRHPSLEDALEETARWCPEQNEGRARRRSSCRPGRAQLIVTSLELLGESVERPDWVRVATGGSTRAR